MALEHRGLAFANEHYSLQFALKRGTTGLWPGSIVGSADVAKKFKGVRREKA
jgi:hypothetical protein